MRRRDKRGLELIDEEIYLIFGEEIWKRFRGNPLRGRWSDQGLSGRCILDSTAWKHFWPEREILAPLLPWAPDLKLSTWRKSNRFQFETTSCSFRNLYFHQIITVQCTVYMYKCIQMSEDAVLHPKGCYDINFSFNNFDEVLSIRRVFLVFWHSKWPHLPIFLRTHRFRGAWCLLRTCSSLK